jgi:hypothetical protein
MRLVGQLSDRELGARRDRGADGKGLFIEIDSAPGRASGAAIVLEVHGAKQVPGSPAPQGVRPEAIIVADAKGLVEIDVRADLIAGMAVDAHAHVRRHQEPAHIHDESRLQRIALRGVCRSQHPEGENCDDVFAHCFHQSRNGGPRTVARRSLSGHARRRVWRGRRRSTPYALAWPARQ